MAEASIVFRNKDMSSTGKIYVNHIHAAARIAATYRDASYYVDVINRFDEVVYRWEAGNVAWGNDDMERITRRSEAYQIARPNDQFWVAENRILLFAEALPYAFDVAIGKEDQYTFDSLLVRMDVTGDEIWDLIREAQSIAKTSARTLGAGERAEQIEEWMQNSQGLFLHYRIEYVALSISAGKFIPDCRIGRLEMELAELEVGNR